MGLEPDSILAAVFGSAVIASVITSLFTKVQSDKSAKINNIIKERKIWRDKLRDLVVEVVACTQRQDSQGIASAEASLVVLLNPVDKKDLAIIEALNRIPAAWSGECLQEFMDRVSYLLKHDWERAKQETTTRISPQTLALASLFVWLVTVASEQLMPLEWGVVYTLEVSALWLSAVFFFVAFIVLIVKYLLKCDISLSWRKFFCWLTNEPFREEYRRRDKR